MAMFSLLRNHRSYAFASSFKLKRSVLPLSYVATRHFLTTSSDHSPAQKAGKVASPNPSTTKPKSESKPDIKSEKKPAALKKQDKPKKILKKDLKPPSKRPMGSFAAFAAEYRAKRLQDEDTFIPLMDTLRGAAAAWAKFSAEEKKAYAPSREAVEAHKAALVKWRNSLSVEAKRALKLRRRRAKGSGNALFVSETFKEAVGNNFGEKVAERAATWNALSSEAKADYTKRAAVTSFGVRARREAQHEREVEREEKRKIKVKAEAEAQKAKEKALKLKEQAKKKAEAAKLRKAAAAQAKKEKEKAKKDLERMKGEAKPGKKKVKTTA